MVAFSGGFICIQVAWISLLETISPLSFPLCLVSFLCCNCRIDFGTSICNRSQHLCFTMKIYKVCTCEPGGNTETSPGSRLLAVEGQVGYSLVIPVVCTYDEQVEALLFYFLLFLSRVKGEYLSYCRR